MSVTLFLLVVAGTGAVLTTVQVLLVARLRRRRSPFELARPAGERDSRPGDSSAPRLSILKPLSDLDDGLEENLASFAALTGISYEVILSAEKESDPAVRVARRVLERFPAAPFRLVLGAPVRTGPVNRKVERLVAAAREARGQILLVSDSNVRVSPADVAMTISLFDDPAIGCVSNLFVGYGARSFGAVLESLHLLTFVVPGVALAEASGFPCVVGKSMAISRRALDAVGGFAAFLGVLAEDQAIGLAVKDAGFNVVVSPVVVRNVVVSRTVRGALARQARWNKIRWSFSKPTYAGEILLNPFPVSLLACGGAALAAPPLLPAAVASAGLILLLRGVQAAALARVTGALLPVDQLLAMPAKDLLQLVTQAAPFLSREVTWNGHRARLASGTLLLPSRREASLAA